MKLKINLKGYDIGLKLIHTTNYFKPIVIIFHKGKMQEYCCELKHLKGFLKRLSDIIEYEENS
jgi:hypothetical protein